MIVVALTLTLAGIVIVFDSDNNVGIVPILHVAGEYRGIRRLLGRRLNHAVLGVKTVLNHSPLLGLGIFKEASLTLYTGRSFSSLVTPLEVKPFEGVPFHKV